MPPSKAWQSKAYLDSRPVKLIRQWLHDVFGEAGAELSDTVDNPETPGASGGPPTVDPEMSRAFASLSEADRGEMVLGAFRHLKAKEAEEEKQQGNHALEGGDVASAWTHYTEAIRLAPHRPELHTNRAAAALRLNKRQEALRDAQVNVGCRSA